MYEVVLFKALHFVSRLVERVGKGCHLFMDIPDTSKCCIVRQAIGRRREKNDCDLFFMDIPDTGNCCIIHQAISRHREGKK